MLKTGNSQPQTCMTNLFSMHEGEVQIDQCRGLRADLTDMPATTAYALLQVSAYGVASVYEPRFTLSALPLLLDSAQDQNYKTEAQIQL